MRVDFSSTRQFFIWLLSLEKEPIMSTRENEIRNLQRTWAEDARWQGIKRGYGADEVVRLRGSLTVEHTLAKRGSEKLWELLNTEDFVNSLGALTGNQAMQQVKAGLKAIYLSGCKGRATPMARARCILTSLCTRPIRCPRWLTASTMP
jgi:hypothetical protein